jgi:dienelactone hydrolase
MPTDLTHAKAESSQDIRITIGTGWIDGDLVVPAGATGLVVFAHGSGSSRFSVRNKAVAARLRQAGLATLLIDLLTRSEEAFDAESGALRFDIQLLAQRVVHALDRIAENEAVHGLPIGLFGASTGAAAALVAAAQRPQKVGAVVSRGGRPDLADAVLSSVKAPTLLIVGGYDRDVLRLNEGAYALLRCEKALEVVPGATHLFEEPGTLDAVADLAAKWFSRHLTGAVAGRAAARDAGA